MTDDEKDWRHEMLYQQRLAKTTSQEILNRLTDLESVGVSERVKEKLSAARARVAMLEKYLRTAIQLGDYMWPKPHPDPTNVEKVREEWRVFAGSMDAFLRDDAAEKCATCGGFGDVRGEFCRICFGTGIASSRTER